MPNIILFVFEGENPETQIYNSLNNIFFSNKSNTLIHATFNAEIYQLCQEIKNDNFLDLIELLKERGNSDLMDISRDDISEIHLFFDHDGHSHTDINDYVIREMLSFFDNETINGMLYISYPMVEALKDCKKNENECMQQCTFKIEDNTNYKEIVSQRSNFIHINRYSKQDWHYITLLNLLKANSLVFGEYDYPKYKAVLKLTQIAIWRNQNEKFISTKNEIAILSAFPFFLITYFGELFFNKIVNLGKYKNCSYSCLNPENLKF